MPNYINADKFIKDQRKFYCEDCYMRKSTSTGEIVYDIGSAACGSCRLNDALNALEDAPTADVEEVKHGYYTEERRCCFCGSGIPTDDTLDFISRNEVKYCYFCGAKMDGEKDNAEQ